MRRRPPVILPFARPQPEPLWGGVIPTPGWVASVRVAAYAHEDRRWLDDAPNRLIQDVGHQFLVVEFLDRQQEAERVANRNKSNPRPGA